ncbi:MAG TPA: hypothetical protein DE060_10395, partial [Lentisphaeria bacterium]|nr:hypothetical protein [Lentisphaeria bacterium]HCG49594.1 hypothetical protein [Lentisphaeria bacterium]
MFSLSVFPENGVTIGTVEFSSCSRIAIAGKGHVLPIRTGVRREWKNHLFSGYFPFFSLLFSEKNSIFSVFPPLTIEDT